MSHSLRTDPYPLRAARRAAASVRVRTCRPRSGFIHPAGPGDVHRLLAFFGPAARYGLHRVELRHSIAPSGPLAAALVLASLPEPGLVVLYEQRRPPWHLAGALSAESAHRLERAGARVEPTATGTRVDWPEHALRDFMLFDGLMHEIGHHRVQHERRAGPVPAMRTADHERRADAFAVACRRDWQRAC